MLFFALYTSILSCKQPHQVPDLLSRVPLINLIGKYGLMKVIAGKDKTGYSDSMQQLSHNVSALL